MDRTEYDNYGRNRKKYARYMQAYRYGITPAQYDSILESQGYVCAICGMTPVCKNCNVAIGYLKDSSENAIAAALYLERYGR